MSSTVVSPLPPNFAFPKFDATLGALYIGAGLATILYGISCLQVFIYVTSPRSRKDKIWLQLFVLLQFALNSAEQAAMMAGLYRFLVTDFLNPFALPSGGPGSAEVFIYVESLLLACISVMIQWFFCWRIWVFTASSFGLRSRIAFTTVTISLSIFSFASYVDLAINGFNHKILTGNTPDFVLAFKLATSSQIAYDIILTTAMTWTLQRARVGSKRTDHVVKLLMLFIINTNLLTTILSIVGLVTFLVLPHATVYGAIGFILGKTYFNAFLSILNAREYLREKFDNSADIHPDFADAGWNHEDTEETATGTYELSPGEIRFASHKVGITREEA